MWVCEKVGRGWLFRAGCLAILLGVPCLAAPFFFVLGAMLGMRESRK